MKIDFLTLYKQARSKHSDLADVPERVLDEFSNQYWMECRRRERGFELAYSSIVVSLVYLLTSVSVVEMFHLTRTVAQRWASHNFQAVFRDVPGLQVGSVLFCVAVIIYFIFVPLVSHSSLKSYLQKRAFFRSRLLDSDFSGWRFWVPGLIAIWAAAGWAIPVYSSIRPPTIEILRLAFTAWLLPAAMLLSLVPSLLLLAVSAITAISAQPERATSNTRVLKDLLNVLARWPDAGASDPTCVKFLRATADDLSKIAAQIRLLYFGTAPRGEDEQWAARQFALAADNLLVCGSWLYVPQQHSVEAVRARVLLFCNAFLTGILSDLPRVKLSESDGLINPRPKRRAVRTVLLTGMVFTYSVVPFAIFMLLRSKIALPSFPESFWLLLYSLWLAVGLFAYLENTSQSTGESLMNLVKIILRK
jgi:hypothetical protein